MITSLIPVPQPLKAKSSVHDLKLRLDWGEPALTIVDVRPRSMYSDLHVTGALHIPLEELVFVASANFEAERDIYIYAEDDEKTLHAANVLRQAGFQSVAELLGGLSAWRSINGSVEAGA